MLSKKLLKYLGQPEWEKYWSLDLSLLHASILGFDKINSLAKVWGKGFTESVDIYYPGQEVCYLYRPDRKKYGEYRLRQIFRRKNGLQKFCTETKKETDLVFKTLKRLKAKKAITAWDFRNFLEIFDRYNTYHMTPKNLVDFIAPDKIDLILRPLTEVRLYTEHTHVEVEKFFRQWAKKLSRRAGIKAELILCCLFEELEKFLATGQLPPKKILQARFSGAAIVYRNKRRQIFVGPEAKLIEKTIARVKPANQLTGQVAYPGKARGIARIIFDPAKKTVFNPGDILVTGMTRPDYLMLMKKSGAIVTDAGGVLSHAAIVSRELKKPCLIGTKVGTKLLKNGMLVEVDAVKGQVKILKK